MTQIDVRQAQLFIDDEIIAHQTLLERVVHQPVRSSHNPLLRPEKPWEAPSLSFIAGVYPDAEAGGYRAWYVTHPTAFDNCGSMLCTATSEDGIHWLRPELEICRDIIGRPSNVLFAAPGRWDGPTVLRDTEDDESPWKLVFYQGGSVYVGTSVDGLRWTMPSEPEVAILPGFGDRTTALLSPDPDEPYVILSRNAEDMRERQLVRAIYRAGSRDARSISSPPELVLRPDLEDGPYVEMYQMSAFRYESLFLGLIERYHTGEPPYADMELTVSRDTRSWHRVRPRTAFFAPPPHGREFGAFDYAVSTPGNSPPIRHRDGPRDELRFYYYGGPSFHGDRFLTHSRCLGLASLRPDGFVSLRAGRREGSVTTRPFDWAGGGLEVNYRVQGGNLWRYGGLEGSDGWLRAEVLGPDGTVLPGFSRTESDPLFRDDTAAELTWGDGPGKLENLAGSRIALRFLLSSAEIYSFRSRRS